MSGATQIFFDAAVTALVAEIAAQFGVEMLEKGLVLRDTSGRLRFLSTDTSPSDEVRTIIESKLSSALGAYARSDGAIAFSDEPGVQTLMRDPAAFPINEGSFSFRLLDRRIVGSAWVARPSEEVTKPPRIVFASLKGWCGPVNGARGNGFRPCTPQ